MSKTKSHFLMMSMVAISALFVVLILPLIGNIHDIEFQSSRGVEFSGATSSGGMPPDSPGWSIFSMMLRVLFVLAGIVFIFQLIANRAFRRLYLVLMVLLFAVILASNYFKLDRREEPSPTEASEWVFPEEEDLNLQPVERDVEASNAQVIILAIILSAAVVVAGAIIFRRWLKNRPEHVDDGLEEILGSITDAAHRLRAGEDPRTVVLFCYQEMIRILSTVGKIDASCLTPREFEARLRGLRLSGDSITELTAIFEIVRYAGRVGDGFAARALACLDAIQEAHAIDER